jgi:hypothetical protein
MRSGYNPSPGTKKVAQSQLSLLKRRARSGSGTAVEQQLQHSSAAAAAAAARFQKQPSTAMAATTAENMSSLANDRESHAHQNGAGGGTAAAATAAHSAYSLAGVQLAPPQEQVEKLTACATCGRTFNSRALAIHVKSCGKVTQKRKPLDMSKQRLGHLDGDARGSSSSGQHPNNNNNKAPAKRKKQPRWKAQSGALRRAMMAARGNEQKQNFARKRGGGMRNRGQHSQNGIGDGNRMHAEEPEEEEEEEEEYDDGLIPCPHCHRRFNQKAAERHIPKCKDIKAKPKTLRRGAGGGAGGMLIKKRNAAVTSTTNSGGVMPGPSGGQSPPRSSKKTNRISSHGQRPPAKTRAKHVYSAKTDWNSSNRAIATPARGETSDLHPRGASGPAASAAATQSSAAPAPTSTYKRSVADASRAGRKAPNTECPHCSRKFTKAVASRHIPKCAGIKAKPKPLSRNRTPGPAYRPPTAGGGRGRTPSAARPAKPRPATSRRHRSGEDRGFRAGFSAGFEESHYDAPSHHAEYEAELASRMEANALQAQQRAEAMTASATKQHRRRPSSADQRFAKISHRNLGVSKRDQPPRRSTSAWDEKSAPATAAAPGIYLGEAGRHYFESPEELPSELDQLHALGDRKFGGGPASQRMAAPQRTAVAAANHPGQRRQQQRTNPAQTSYRGRISAEQLVEEAGRARARPAPEELSHAPSFVGRAGGERGGGRGGTGGYRQQSRPVVHAMDPAALATVTQLKQDVEQSAMTVKMERLARELNELDSLLGKKQKLRRR